MISEKTRCRRRLVLESNGALSWQRRGETAATMTLADRWNASKDGESGRDRWLIDTRCGTFAETIGHLSMLDTAPFARAEVRPAFDFSVCCL